MKVLLAKKAGMTQFFDENAIAHAVTVLAFAEMTIIDLKTESRDGYNAIVVGYGSQKAHRVARAQKNQYQSKEVFYVKVKEFRVEDSSKFEIGQMLTVEQFAAGDIVDIAGISKGKGFQGGVKRYGFAGSGPLHNQRHAARQMGSIGGGGRAGGRVVKGKRMPGRMGADRINVKNLKVVAVDANTKTILVKGAVPGIFGGTIEVLQK